MGTGLDYGRRMSPRTARRVLVVISVVVVLLTLGPLPRQALDLVTGMVSDLTGRQAVGIRADVERISNVLLFLLPAFLAAAAFPRVPRWAVVAAAVVLSSTIELVQAVALTNRHAELRDVALNSFGALTGAWMSAWWSARPTLATRTPPVHRAERGTRPGH